MKLLQKWVLAVLICLSSNAWAVDCKLFPIFAGTDSGVDRLEIGNRASFVAEQIKKTLAESKIQVQLNPLPIVRLKTYKLESQGGCALIMWGNQAYASMLGNDYIPVVTRTQKIKPIFAVRTNSGINSLEELKGKKVGVNPEAMVVWAGMETNIRLGLGINWVGVNPNVSQAEFPRLITKINCKDPTKLSPDIDCRQDYYYSLENQGIMPKLDAILVRKEVALSANERATKIGKPATLKLIGEDKLPDLAGFALMVHPSLFKAVPILGNYLTGLKPSEDCNPKLPKSDAERMLNYLNVVSIN